MSFTEGQTQAPSDQVIEGDVSDQVFIPQDGEQAENLYNQVMNSGVQPPAEPAGTTPPAEQAAPATNPDDPMHTITWNGEEKQVPLSELTNLAQQGYNYQFKMRDLNKAQDAFKTEQQQFAEQQERLKQYGEVEEWAKQNPQLWEHALQSFRQAQDPAHTQGAGENQFSPEAMSVINGLKEEITSLKKDVGEVKETHTTAQQQAEDEALDRQVKDTMTQYSDFDWAGRDENGLTMEDRVVKYAMDTGINDFNAAFKVMNHDQLIKRAQLSAKEQIGKERQKAPVVRQPATKPTGITNANDVRTKSYDDLAEEGLREALAEG